VVSQLPVLFTYKHHSLYVYEFMLIVCCAAFIDSSFPGRLHYAFRVWLLIWAINSRADFRIFLILISYYLWCIIGVLSDTL